MQKIQKRNYSLLKKRFTNKNYSFYIWKNVKDNNYFIKVKYSLIKIWYIYNI